MISSDTQILSNSEKGKGFRRYSLHLKCQVYLMCPRVFRLTVGVAKAFWLQHWNIGLDQRDVGFYALLQSKINRLNDSFLKFFEKPWYLMIHCIICTVPVLFIWNSGAVIFLFK